MSIKDEQEIRERLRLLGTVEVSPAPYLAAVRRGKSVRLRRRAFAAAGVAAAVLVGVLVPRLVPHAGQPAPVMPRYNVTVHQPAPGSPSGQVAWGTINGKRWQIRVKTQQGMSNGCTFFGRDLECVPGEASASRDQVSFVYARSGSTQFQLAAIGAGVTKVAVTLGNGSELTLRPTVVDGKRWVAFAAPVRLAVSRAVSFAGQRELGYAIPFNGASGATFVAWLRPGQQGAARESHRIGSGMIGGVRWSSWAYTGPWGVCVEGVGGANWCAPSPADLRPDDSPTSYFTCSPGSQGVWFAAAAQPSVVRVRFGLSDGRSLNVAAVRIAGGGRAYAFAVPNGARLQIWDAYNAAGRLVGVGPGWKCG
ncbi:MAG TPA: hypothetical protein VMC83_36775 [Streptosporangiaceae bacterium]|nr:hypothetical protein [Streptosporangiaceae bacterium]